jgi:hypothetical protein
VHPRLVEVIFYLSNASNEEDQMSVAKRRFWGDSEKLLVVGLEGHVIGLRLVVCFREFWE